MNPVLLFRSRQRAWRNPIPWQGRYFWRLFVSEVEISSFSKIVGSPPMIKLMKHFSFKKWQI